MYAEVDVFISNYTLVDADIFQLWTEGYSCKWWPSSGYVLCALYHKWFQFLFKFSTATEAVHFQNTKGVAKNMSAPLELIASGIFYSAHLHKSKLKGEKNLNLYLCNRCAWPLSYVCTAWTVALYTNQIIGAAILSAGATKSTTADRKVCALTFEKINENFYINANLNPLDTTI